jgi:hypothetical protein
MKKLASYIWNRKPTHHHALMKLRAYDRKGTRTKIEQRICHTYGKRRMLSSVFPQDIAHIIVSFTPSKDGQFNIM